MSHISLGRLVSLPVREAWKDEARDFTPWLAEADNLALLGAALNLELELEAQEKSVGPFRADILCKLIGGDDHWVLIENQLARTDHNHLGQLLTYASGLDAVTIIWIADRFTEEHRSTLDWLNRITDEDFRFFGVEVEIWRIGDSAPAPKFNIVSKPNNWSKAVSSAARRIENSELTDTKLFQVEYWGAFHEMLNKVGGAVSGNRKPQPQSWMSYSIGRTGVGSNAAMRLYDGHARVEIYMSGANAKSYFHQLSDDRDQIDEAFGPGLVWDELPEGLDSRIFFQHPQGFNFEDRAAWPQQHEWLALQLNKIHTTFKPFIRKLN